MSSAIRAKFAHLQHEFTEAELSKYGSPHFSRKEAGEELSRRYRNLRLSPVTQLDVPFRRDQITCANEVFPEAALSDPIADLELWDEWRNGTRAFPFPGRYSRLGLTRQDNKISSPTSVCVIGEIFTGLFAQVFVSPWVAVRPIRRWPDFVFLRDNHRYARVESKAFTGLASFDGVGGERRWRRVLADGFYEAMQDLNSDPTGEIWLFFTSVERITPLEVTVMVIELSPPASRRGAVNRPNIPHAVVEGLAEQALARAAARVDTVSPSAALVTDTELFSDPAKRQLAETATEELDEVLVDAVPPELLGEARDAIRAQIRKKSKKLTKPETGRRLTAAKEVAAAGRLGLLRTVGSEGQTLLMADLLKHLRQELRRTWHPAWSRANLPWGLLGQLPLWRCSSAVVAKGGEDAIGTDISDARRVEELR